jgi:hypothetical protein
MNYELKNNELRTHTDKPNVTSALPLPDKPNFLIYMLLTGPTEAVNNCFQFYKDLAEKVNGKKPEV